MDPSSLVDCRQGDHAGPLASLVFVWGVFTIPLLITGIAALVGWAKGRFRARRERALSEAHASLSPGFGVVQGVVEAEGDPVDLPSIEIEQVGAEWQEKSKWYHQWVETRRRVHAPRFVVRMDSGERVKVEPDQRMMLIDRLRTAAIRQMKRTQRAALSVGERVFVTGMLSTQTVHSAGGGYRGASQTQWVVRPPKDRMLISSEPLGRRFLRLAGFHRTWLLIVAIIWLVTHASAFLAYHVREVGGRVIEATVTAKVRVPKPKKNYDDRIQAQPVGKAGLFDESVSTNCYLEVQAGDRVRFLVVPGVSMFDQVGEKPTTFVFALILVAILHIGTIASYLITLRDQRMWYDMDRVNDKREGKLPLGPVSS